MFFLLSDLVTYFGDLVHDRLVTKCPDLKVNFTFSDVGPQAKELCKNWLYKIGEFHISGIHKSNIKYFTFPKC